MDRFVPYILQYVPSCPTFTIKSQLLTIADDFCRRTGIWKVKVEGTAIGGENEITVTSSLPTGSQIIRAELVVNDQPYYRWDRASNVITLEDDLTVGDEYEVSLFLTPTRTATALPDLLFNDWFLGIVSGVKADVMLMPGKTWNDPQMAAVEKQTYMFYVGQAMGQSSRRHKHQSQYISFAGTSWV